MKKKIADFLIWSERYTKTDMVYVTSGSFWWLIGKLAVFIASFASMIAFANWISKEQYGIYQFVMAGIGIFSIFTLSGINVALIKSVAQGKEGTLNLAKREKIKWGLVGSLLSLIVAGWYLFQGNHILALSFLVVALILPFREAFQIFLFFWNGKKRFDLQAKYHATSSFLSALSVIIALYFSNNIVLIIAVFLVSHTLFDWYFYSITQKYVKGKEEDYEAIRFGKNLTFMRALQTISAHFDKIILWKFLGATPVALYSFAQLPIQKFQEILPIAPLALPKLGESKIEGNRKKGIFLKFLKLFAFSIPLSIFLFFAGFYLYKFLFPQYMESVIYFQALTILITLSPFSLLESSLVAETKKKSLYIIQTITPLSKIALFLMLIPFYGIWGIVWAVIATEILRNILILYFFKKI